MRGSSVVWNCSIKSREHFSEWDSSCRKVMRRKGRSITASPPRPRSLGAPVPGPRSGGLDSGRLLLFCSLSGILQPGRGGQAFSPSFHGRSPRMRILLVADIHANWPALRALDEPFDVCLCLGDLVDYGL